MKKDCWYNKKNEEKSPTTSPSHSVLAVPLEMEKFYIMK